MLKLSIIVLNNKCVKEKTPRKLENILRQMGMKIQHTKIKGMQKKAIPRGKFISVNAYAAKKNDLILIHKKKKKILN